MPAVVIAVAASAASYGAAAAAVAAGWAVAGSFTAALIGAAAATVVSGVLGKVLMPSPKQKAQSSVAQQEAGTSTVIRSAVESHKIIYGRKKISGTLIFSHTTKQGYASQANLSSFAPTLVTDSRDNAFLHMVIALAGHELDAIEEVYLGDTLLTLDGNGYATNAPFQANYIDANGADQGVWRFAKVKTYLGTDTQTAEPDLINLYNGWTSAHRLQGVAYLYVCLRWYGRVFPNGIPNITAVVRGRKVYDPRTTLTAYSNNWALCVRDYLTNTRFGVGCTDSELDDATIIAAANISDESISLTPSGTQARYTMDGAIDTGEDFASVLDKMSSAAAGVITYSQGKFQVYAGAYSTPTVTVDPSWLRGNIQVQAKTPRKERFNAVRGVYVEPSKLWQPTDFPAVANSTYATEDGEVIYRDLELSFVTQVERAQRIATLYLEQSRRGITCTLPCNFKALQLRIWQVIMLTMPMYGFASKPFRVTSWRLSPEGGVDLELKEDMPSIYAWGAAQAALYPNIPATNLPRPTIVAPAGTPVITEEIYQTTEGSGVKSRALITWVESTGPFVWRYRLEYKKSSETDYRVALETPATLARLEDLEPDTYNFRVRAINTLLAESEYSGIGTFTLVGLTAPPADISGLNLVELKGSAHLSWDQPADLDVRIGGAIRVRHSPATTGATWSSAVDIGPRLSGITTNATLPLVTGTYMVKAVDSTGTESVNASPVVCQIADIVNMNLVVTDTENPTFTGTKTNMTLTGSVLQLTAGQTSGSYLFSTSGGACIDLKQVIRCRLTATIAAVIYRSDLLFDSGAGLFDDGVGLFDGADITGVAAQLFMRSTNDDPAGTPTWSAWRQFFVGDYENRAFQFRLDVESDDVSKNIDVSTLEVRADVPDRDARHLAVSVGTGGTTTTYDLPFYTKPMVVPVIQSSSAGDNCIITHNSSGGKFVSFTATCYNIAGVAVARTCDFYVRGY